MLALYMAFVDDETDKTKFEILYYAYRDRMYVTAESVLHNRQDAEDAVHDTFLKIARNMKSIDDPHSQRTLSYVLKATKNTAINLLHKNKAKTTVNFEDMDELSDADFLENLNITENYQRIVHAILDLDDTYKDVLFFHFVQEMKIDQVAELLGRKKSTVKQQLVRGKKILLEVLEEK